MITTRLFVDGSGQVWAIVECERCNEVGKYPALLAFDAPVQCKCGHAMGVRDRLVAELPRHDNLPDTLRRFADAAENS